MCCIRRADRDSRRGGAMAGVRACDSYPGSGGCRLSPWSRPALFLENGVLDRPIAFVAFSIDVAPPVTVTS